METPPRPSSSRSAPSAAPSPSGPVLRLPPTPDPRGARAFAGVAAEFERGRPGYPAEALAWLVKDPRSQVVDVGAGTGKLSRGLVAAGHDVMAVEPVAEMVDQLREAVPQAHAVRGRAEALPAVSRSVDVVLAAESFQWFDASAFLAEATRVLRPGGLLGLLWNEPDVRVPWVRRLATAIGADHLLADPDESALPHAAVDDTGQFESVEQRSFRVWHRMRKSQLRDFVACRPDVVARGPVALERLLEEVDALFDDASTGAELAMPLTTHCFRAAVLPWAYVGAPRRATTRSGRSASAVDAVLPSSATEGDEPTEPVDLVAPTDESASPEVEVVDVVPHSGDRSDGTSTSPEQDETGAP